jgi:hypothetical protein
VTIWFFPDWVFSQARIHSISRLFLQMLEMLGTEQLLMKVSMSGMLWWVRQVVLILLGSFFLLFGIHLLILAYRLNDPSWFIMMFFASNLIILISAALLVGFILRIVNVLKRIRNQGDPDA